MIHDETQGIVFDIQRFCIHDGPGIRTTVFLKGCPLHCLWCHNPESQERRTEIFFSPEKCIGCRSCEAICPNGSHVFQDGIHVYQRDRCDGCGQCTAQCYTEALEVAGKLTSAGQVLELVRKDIPFYRNSGGGMTLSGGEPMLQFDFARALLQSAHQEGIHTCIETSGCAPFAHYQEILPFVDLFLVDVKEIDPDRHRQYTGVSNAPLLENLLTLDRAGAATILRCPLIPGLNDRAEHFQGIAALAEKLRHVVEVNVLPYHELGTSKNQRLGKIPALNPTSMPEPAQAQAWVDEIQKLTRVTVKRI
jgi:glycyl-radical enzyme activating protein